MLEKPDNNMMGGLVAVIIPVYNTEAYLAKCLDSVLEQSYSNLDVIVVDDGSTDGSLEILQQYAAKDSRVRIFTQPNSGQAVARNTALAALKSETEFICFVDSDDCLADNAIEAMLNCIENKTADMVMGLYDKINPEGKQLYICKNNHYNDDDVISRSEMFALLVKHLISKYTYVWGKLYRKQVVDGLVFPPGKVYEDSICHRLYGKCKRIAFLNMVVYHYNMRPGSTVLSGFDIRRLDKVEVFIDRIQYLRNEGFPEYSTRCLGQAFVLMREILTKVPQLDTAIRERVKNLRRLLAIEYRKSSFDGFSLKERVACWANNYLFWLLYYRWKHHYRKTRDKIQ